MGLIKFPCHLFDKTSPSRFSSPMPLATTLSTSSCGVPGANNPELTAARTMPLRARQCPTSDGLRIVVHILGRHRSAESSQCACGNVCKRFYDPWRTRSRDLFDRRTLTLLFPARSDAPSGNGRYYYYLVFGCTTWRSHAPLYFENHGSISTYIMDYVLYSSRFVAVHIIRSCNTQKHVESLPRPRHS